MQSEGSVGCWSNPLNCFNERRQWNLSCNMLYYTNANWQLQYQLLKPICKSCKFGGPGKRAAPIYIYINHTFRKKTVEFKSWPTNGWIPPTAPRTTMATIPAVPTSGELAAKHIHEGMVEEYRSSIFRLKFTGLPLKEKTQVYILIINFMQTRWTN